MIGRRGLTVGRLMVAIVLVAINLAILRGATQGDFWVETDPTLKMAFSPSITAFGLVSHMLIEGRGKGRRFLKGFAAGGWLSMAGYAACCRIFPDIVLAPVVYYVTEVEPGVADYHSAYLANLEVLGLILATPGLVFATLVGLASHSIGKRRWNLT